MTPLRFPDNTNLVAKNQAKNANPAQLVVTTVFSLRVAKTRQIADLRPFRTSSPGQSRKHALAVVRNHLSHVLGGEGPGAGFISGRITFCALKPMRSIPARLIAISGLNNEAFPRRRRPAAFDLQAQAPVARQNRTVVPLLRMGDRLPGSR